jgi:hypothetical protein
VGTIQSVRNVHTEEAVSRPGQPVREEALV